MSGVELHILEDGETVPMLRLGRRPMHVGRAPDNDLVVAERTVSSRHATVWIESGRIWLRDQGSKNGTYINDKRIRGAVEVKTGDEVRFGLTSKLTVHGSVSEAMPVPRSLLVEDVAHNVRFPVHGQRFFIGASENADLRIDDPEAEALIFFHGDGEIWLGTYEHEGPIELGNEFDLGGRTFRVIEVESAYTLTFEASPTRFPYRLRVTLNGVSGPEAEIEDPGSGNKHTIAAENRAILLYVLGKAAADESDDSWCADESVARDIWGRKGAADTNGLHVLVHRLRKELKKAGFDPWFIEKRRKAIRIALDEVEVR